MRYTKNSEKIILGILHRCRNSAERKKQSPRRKFVLWLDFTVRILQNLVQNNIKRGKWCHPKNSLWKVEKYHEVNIKIWCLLPKTEKYYRKRLFLFLLNQQFIEKKLPFSAIFAKKSNNCRFHLKVPTGKAKTTTPFTVLRPLEADFYKFWRYLRP